MVHHELSVQCSKTSTSSGIASTDDEDEVDDVDNDDIDEKPLEVCESVRVRKCVWENFFFSKK